MKIYTVLQIGEHHINHCEDYLLTAEIGVGKLLCAVMDGCSMGTDSYFAATLTGKILRKIAKEHQFREFIERTQQAPAALLKTVLRQLFEELRHARNQLQLERDELLHTLVISIADLSTGAAEFMCIGDGLICIDGQLFEFEQDDRPDYLGYHLQEDFESWFESQQQRISRQQLRDFSLCSDGIFTFKRFDTAPYNEPGDVIELLLRDTGDMDSENMLHRKMIAVKTNWGLLPTDDLAIIRVAFGQT
jgi:serine/threonine protein phosphatase PrpC